MEIYRIEYPLSKKTSFYINKSDLCWGTHIKPICCLRLLKFIVVQFVFAVTAAAAKLCGICHLRDAKSPRRGQAGAVNIFNWLISSSGGTSKHNYLIDTTVCCCCRGCSLSQQARLQQTVMTLAHKWYSCSYCKCNLIVSSNSGQRPNDDASRLCQWTVAVYDLEYPLCGISNDVCHLVNASIALVCEPNNSVYDSSQLHISARPSSSSIADIEIWVSYAKQQQWQRW